MEARILPGWVLADGTRMVAIDMTLAPGWKTYWRAPGDAGIPPAFDWSGSRNLAGVSIHWPRPEIFDQNGMRSLGYKDRLILPLSIAPGQAGQDVRLTVAVDMGVCSDICVPYRLSLDATIDTATTRPVPAIASALAQQPFAAREAGVRTSTCRIEPIADGLRIETRVSVPSAGGQEFVVIEPGVGDVWVSEATAQRTGGEIVATSDMLHTEGRPFAIDRSAIRITILGESRAIDIRGCSAG